MSIVTPPSEENSRATTTEEHYNSRTFSPVLKTNRIVLTSIEEQRIKVRVDFSLNLVRPSSASLGENTISSALQNLDYENLFLVFVAYDNTNTSRVRGLFNGQSSTSFSDLFKGPEGQQFMQTGGLVKRISNVVEEVLSRPARQVAAAGYYNSQNIEYEYSSTVELEYDSSELVPAQDLTGLFLLGGICLIPPPTDGEVVPEIPNFELSYSMPITELTYDKLADFTQIPDSYGGSSLTISPSRVRSIFYINDPRPEYTEVNLRPYSGPYSQSPETGEWYAGLSSDNTGPRLEIRNTVNRKVSTSTQLWATPETIAGLSSIGQYQTTGEDLNNFIKTLNNINPTTYTFNDSIMKARQMAYYSRESQKDKTNSIIAPWSREATWLYKDPDETDDDLQSSYNCIIGIRFFDLIAQNSLLGFLLKTHLQLWKSGQMESGAIINEILSSSNIIKMSILRRRLTNAAYNNNDQDTKVYGDFQKNQINTNVADLYDNLETQSYYSSGARYSSAPLFESPAVSVEEVEMDWQFYTPQEEAIQDEDDDFQIDTFLTRSFLLKDYEMFYNLDFGKYTYDVEIYANDGIKKVLDTHINSLSEKLLNLDRNIKILSQPVVWNDSKTTIESGHYDQYKRRFYNVPEEFLEEYLESLRLVMNEVNRSFCLITGVPNILPKVQDVEDNNDQITAFLSLLDPRGTSTTLDTINLFYKKSKLACDVLKGVLKDTFFTTATYDSRISSDKAIRSTEEIHVPNATGHNSCIIYKKAKTGIVHDASETNKLVANYDFPFTSLLSEFGNFMRSAAEQAARSRAIAEIARGRQETLADRNITITDPGSVSFPNVYSDNLITFENPYATNPNTRNFPIFNLNFVPNSFETIITPTLDISLGTNLQKSYVNINTMNNNITSGVKKFLRTGANVGSNYKILGNSSQSSYKITNQQYNSANPGVKANIDAKLFVSSQLDANLTGATAKDDIYNYSLVSSGEDTRFTGTTGGAIKVEDIALHAISIVGIEGEDSLLTDEVKSTIVGAIVESKSDIDFINNIRNKYKDLIQMREALGKMFQVFNRISTLNISNSVFGGQKTYKKIFEEGINVKDQTKLDIQVDKNKFNDESCKLYTLSPKGEKIKISKLPDIRKTTQKGAVQKIALIKAEKVSVSENNTNKVAKVNNATLIRL